MRDEPVPVGLPDHLRPPSAGSGSPADPFAVPPTPADLTGRGRHPEVAAAPAPAPALPISGAPAPQITVEAINGFVACPCSCGCGQPTTLPMTPDVVPGMTRLLRCEPCVAEGHRSLPSKHAQKRHVQVRTSRVLDPDAQAQMRADAENVEAELREAAIDRFMEAIPLRWRARLDGEALPASLETLLARLADKEAWREAPTRNINAVPMTSVLLAGVNSSGKTWWAYQAMQEAVRRRLLWPQHCLYGTETDLFGPIVMGTYLEANTARKRLRDPRKRLVMIDDVGTFKHHSDDARHALYYEIVNAVYENHGTLILTTNLDPTDMTGRPVKAGATDPLRHFIGDAAYARLQSMLIGRAPMTFDDATRRAMFANEFDMNYATEGARGDGPR